MSNANNNSLSINEVIDQRPLGAYQWTILILCALGMILDGFDVQAMAYVAPALLKEWGIDKATLGPVFGAGLFGLLVGSLVFSVVSDKLGRRPVLIATTLLFGLLMLATPWAKNLEQLIAIRFVTGLALGAVMPNAMALCGEFSPAARRVSVMMFISCGFTVGALLGGVLASYLIPHYGWQSVFYLGGVAPVLVAVAMYFLLPESLQFKALKGAGAQEIQRVFERMYPKDTAVAASHYSVLGAKQASQPVLALFQEGRSLGTLMLWAISFCNLIGLYFLSNWLPTLSNAAGLDLETAVLVGATLQLGGTVGTLSMGWIIDKKGFASVMIPCFATAAIGIALLGFTTNTPTWLFVVVFVVGFAVVGGQPAINALAASFYPTSLRTTGVGWSLGIGRIGSVIGPVVGGELLRLNWGYEQLFMVVAIPSVVIVLILLVSQQWLKRTQ